MGLLLSRATLHSRGIALGCPVEVVQGGVALRVVRTLPCKADRAGFLPHCPMAYIQALNSWRLSNGCQVMVYVLVLFLLTETNINECFSRSKKTNIAS